MKTTNLIAAGFLALALAAACGDDDGPTPTADAAGDPDGAADIDGAPAPDAGTPAAPVIGDAIDRMGRPAIATALIEGFDLNSPSTKVAERDAYNQNDDPTTWVAMYAAEMAGNLAILDSLDDDDAAGGCGNQLVFSADTGYATLGAVLADDRLWVDTDNDGTCLTYLAVEGAATGVAANNACGGRMPAYDVIQTTYSALAAGLLAGVDDTIAANDAEFGDTFPFLAAPHAQ